MCDHNQDNHLETDEQADYSQMNNRLNSFFGSPLAHMVPAERLARAGFYFTGYGDRVCCFSCQKTVENWYMGDTPVDRHKEVIKSTEWKNGGLHLTLDVSKWVNNVSH